MAILAKNKEKNPEEGYTKDIRPFMKALLPLVKQNNFKMLTNSGGLNPEAAQELVLDIAIELGITDLKVQVVTGDNVMPNIDELTGKGDDLSYLETKEPYTDKDH